jgi:hypothetical protein
MYTLLIFLAGGPQFIRRRREHICKGEGKNCLLCLAVALTTIPKCYVRSCRQHPWHKVTVSSDVWREKWGHILKVRFIKKNGTHIKRAFYKKTPLIAFYNDAFNFHVFITFLQNICLIRRITCDNHACYVSVSILYAHKNQLYTTPRLKTYKNT